MATAKVTRKPQEDLVPDVPEDLFEYTLPDGVKIVCGKPKGVLKLRLRQILSEELRKDPEINAMATAFLCIRSVGGKPFWLRTELEFEAFMNRFGSDQAIDEFMNKYQELVNPGLTKVLNEVLQEAVEKKLKPEDVETLIAERVMAFEVEKRGKVRD